MIQSLDKYEDTISNINSTLQEIRANLSDEYLQERALQKLKLNNLLAKAPHDVSKYVHEKIAEVPGPLTFDIINENKEILYDQNSRWVREKVGVAILFGGVIYTGNYTGEFLDNDASGVGRLITGDQVIEGQFSNGKGEGYGRGLWEFGYHY